MAWMGLQQADLCGGRHGSEGSAAKTLCVPSGVASVQQNPNHLLPFPRPLALTVCATLCPPRTLGGPSESPRCWVKPGQAAAEPAASEA